MTEETFSCRLCRYYRPRPTFPHMGDCVNTDRIRTDSWRGFTLEQWGCRFGERKEGDEKEGDK